MAAEDIVLYSSIALGGVALLLGLLTIWHSRYKGIGMVLGKAETIVEGAGLYFGIRLVIDSNAPPYKWAVLVPGATGLLMSVSYILMSFNERYTRILASFETTWFAAGIAIIIGGSAAATAAEKLTFELFLLTYAGRAFNILFYVWVKFFLYCCLKVEEYILKPITNILTGISGVVVIFTGDLPKRAEFVPFILVQFSRAIDYYDIFKTK